MNSILRKNPESGAVQLPGDVLAEIQRNNTAFPDVQNVIFNLKTEDKEGKRLEKPVLATTVEFADGTKVSVTNSAHDEVRTEMKSFSLPALDAEGKEIIGEDGKKVLEKKFEVEVPTEGSRELGVVHAIVKRLVGRENEKGEFIGDGYGRKLHDWVSGAYLQNFDVPRIAAEREFEAEKNRIAARKPRVRRGNPSLAETVGRLAAVVEKLEARMAALEGGNH